jgi:hypothetical protein
MILLVCKGNKQTKEIENGIHEPREKKGVGGRVEKGAQGKRIKVYPLCSQP